ncbi:MAG: hypothetical protein H6625_00740 [Bdellovibrionaceae bacterium]|nr:hypothetical protein [Pseudobdellovibrionaceae bacterium]
MRLSVKFQTHILYFTFFYLIITPSPHLLKAEDCVGILQYMESPIPKGQMLCELADDSGQTYVKYYIHDFLRNVLPENDTSGALKLNSINEKQGRFLEVRLEQLATSVKAEETKKSQIFDFYIKLNWKGQRAGTLNIDLSDQHIIKGQVIRNQLNKLDIKIIAVPDLFVLSMFMPSLEIAEIFGRNANTEAEMLEHEIKLWMTLLISPILESYFSASESNDTKIKLNHKL